MSSFPVRCCTCGKVVSVFRDDYIEQVNELKLSHQKTEKVSYLTLENREKTPEGQVMDELGLTNYCCRRIMMTSVQVLY
jgi:DNA-directed RNA polymerase I, II, and III subunit RPABC5